jgi:hypothetical protein
MAVVPPVQMRMLYRLSPGLAPGVVMVDIFPSVVGGVENKHIV